ncbi:ATPase [Pollutimonas sp. M17]|uniref:ATPase n=1 Tax=Pollutimonas sp. M17 TaxID=2962065 RepID=UPI0021F40757|nr:ATPase [Pollutimonas sp. M17]UYO95566.1 ATPase [Pollutimonas sp. M17]
MACGSPYDTGNILLDKRLRQSMVRHTVTGWGLCPEHGRMFEEGFIALVECGPQRSGVPSLGRIDPEQAYRTGWLAHLRREVFAKVFNVPISAQQPFVFVEPEVIDHLQAMIEPAAD